ncbi:hypothetical protein HNS38_09225 [Lentimicrobium sp. L6]|uniref:type IX secretion system anionic LPS delivery protein PorZ n=1 Tax=Lentimicrobium sp. L6 TaxID=2735916 RepID=UPI001551D9CD|nr:hypothetical protein [Lentimicrobium sp. L6]NPD84938.1 hypothetical protein [Lentimicrobium sp. L6]
MNKIFTFFALILSLSVFSQSISIGDWRDELPYREAIAVAIADDIIYAVTPYSLFTLRKSDEVMKRYSKINGLSDFGVSTIEYNKAEDVLVIAYSNTNIDLVKDGEIINISDIKRKQILGKKTINNIYFIDEIAYLSCGFGIVLLDVKKEEIKDTWYIGDDGNALEVFDISRLGNDIYAATEEGLRKADLSSQNLADFQSWTVVTEVPHSDGVFDQVENHQGKILVNHHPDNNLDSIFILQDNTWSPLEIQNVRRNVNLTSGNRYLYLYRTNALVLYQPELDSSSTVSQNGLSYSMKPAEVAEDSDGSFWIADELSGLVNTIDFYRFSNYILNGPRTANVFDMSAQGNRLVVAPGGRDDSYANVYNSDGVFSKIDGEWVNYYKGKDSALDTIYDMVCVSVNPNNINQYALGSWGRGVTVFNSEGVEAAYGISNSTLTPYNGTTKTLRIGGVAYDDAGSLWVNCAYSNALMHRLSPTGEWTAWELGASSAQDVGKMMVDSRGYKWMQMRQGGSNYIFVFDETQEPGNQLKGLNSYPNNGNIPGSTVTAIADDLDGEIWLGTDAGIGVIYNAYGIFNGGDFDAQRIIVEKDGYAQYLLEAEKVKAIAVNGANQKWVGTERGGLFLLSADGQEEIYHFTSENSPLYSNNVVAIDILDNGEVYIGTDKGVIVFKDSPVPPEPKLTDDVYAYPNPVRPDYNGVIAIKGLVRDANIRITDVYGGLVHQSVSYGGQAIWDGHSLNRGKVNTGVYLVYISDDLGNETMVTKILFVK